MKTPKRTHCNFYSRAEMDIMRNRWKRKNKERQLKNTIAKLKQQVKFQAERAQGLREMYIEANKRVVFLEMKLALDIRHNKNR